MANTSISHAQSVRSLWLRTSGEFRPWAQPCCSLDCSCWSSCSRGALIEVKLELTRKSIQTLLERPDPRTGPWHYDGGAARTDRRRSAINDGLSCDQARCALSWLQGIGSP